MPFALEGNVDGINTTDSQGKVLDTWLQEGVYKYTEQGVLNKVRSTERPSEFRLAIHQSLD